MAVEILSDTPDQDLAASDLDAIHYDITNGDASGLVELVDHRQISRQDMTRLLKRHGSDPAFLRGNSKQRP